MVVCLGRMQTRTLERAGRANGLHLQNRTLACHVREVGAWSLATASMIADPSLCSRWSEIVLGPPRSRIRAKSSGRPRGDRTLSYSRHTKKKAERECAETDRGRLARVPKCQTERACEGRAWRAEEKNHRNWSTVTRTLAQGEHAACNVVQLNRFLAMPELDLGHVRYDAPAQSLQSLQG